MAQMLAVRYDDKAIRDLERQARDLRGGLASVAPAAINRVNRWSRTQIRRAVAKQARMKQKRVNRLLRESRASRSRMRAHVEVQNRRIGIGKFVAGRSRRRRVTATYPSGVTQSYPSAFHATMPSGHRGIYVRAGRRRLPIWEVRERIGRVLDMGFLPRVQKQGAARLNKELASKIRWRLQRQRGRA